jgi:hypothetical protein
MSLKALSLLFAAVSMASASIDVYFSPNGGATDAIVKEISGAKNEILVQAFPLQNLEA